MSTGSVSQNLLFFRLFRSPSLTLTLLGFKGIAHEVLNSKRNEMVKSQVNYRCRGSLLSCRFIDPVGMLPYSVASPAITS